MASARGSSKESSFGIDYERMEESDSSSFSDPFAAPAEDYGDVMMSRADYGLKESSGSSDSYLDSSSSSPSSSSSGSRLDVGHLSSALGASSLPFGAGLAQKRERPAEAATTWGNERRGVWGAASYNIGYSYFGGLVVGGALGVASGLRYSPTRNPRIVFNSILNWTGKLGARTGNAAGVLALLYTVLERQLEDAELDKLPGAVNNALGMDVFRRYRSDVAIPALSAFATGALFTLPRALSMRGVDAVRVSAGKRAAVCAVGGASAVLGVGVLSVVGPLVFGERSPFRFA